MNDVAGFISTLRLVAGVHPKCTLRCSVEPGPRLGGGRQETVAPHKGAKEWKIWPITRLNGSRIFGQFFDMTCSRSFTRHTSDSQLLVIVGAGDAMPLQLVIESLARKLQHL